MAACIVPQAGGGVRGSGQAQAGQRPRMHHYVKVCNGWPTTYVRTPSGCQAILYHPGPMDNDAVQRPPVWAPGCWTCAHGGDPWVCVEKFMSSKKLHLNNGIVDALKP